MSDRPDTSATKFWVEDVCVLFSDVVILPQKNMTRAEVMNALTRLAILIAIVMYVMEYKHWLTFLLVSVLSIVVMEYASKAKDEKEKKLEHFSVVPTRISSNEDFHETIVAPLFSEELRVPPPSYDLLEPPLYTTIPEEEPIRPQSFPYSQYLSRTNLLPSDEYLAHMNPTGGAKTAREFAASAFTKHDMAFRENMTRIYKKQLQRRFRHNLNDSYSPYHSY